MPAQIYRFGHFRIDERERLVACNGRVIPLRAKVFETLCVLTKNAGRLMRKDELMRAIWPDRVVEENNLQHNLSVLRKVFRQSGSGRKFIETIPRQGYRFVAKVQVINDPVATVPQAVPFADLRLARPEDELLRHGAPTQPPQGGHPVTLIPDRPLRENVDILRAVAKEGMLVLVLEDVHWRDGSTLEVRLRIACEG